jgi:uncharacterized repeat protein (TIGR04138 family)
MSKQRSFYELLANDKRYKREAYQFVFEALRYAHEKLGLGSETPVESIVSQSSEETTEAQRHLTGRELCEAIRRFALEQFGYMANTVLNSWGVHNTGDFGNIVFNLIDIGEMSKTKQDRREDFDNVFDFETDLRQEFRIDSPPAK